MSTAGPNICGTGADDATVGTTSWSNPTSIQADDGTNSSTSGSGSAVTHYLKATNFGFSIPSGSIIDGIQVTFERFYMSSSPTDSEIKIVKGGSISSTNRSAGATWSSSVGTTNTFGSTSDLWGETWTYSDINASNFGVVMSVTLAAGMTICNVDRVSITITYHAGSSVPVDAYVPLTKAFGAFGDLHIMQKNVAGQKIGAQMVTASDGSAFTSTVTVYVTGDAGTQALGSVGSGVCTHEGNGYHTYAPAQAETNYDLIAFTFIGTGAVPTTVQCATQADANVKQWLGTAVSTPTVAGVPNVNAKTWNDLATVALPLVPTTAGRTLDVSAGGEAGIDWANIGSPTTSVNLSGTSISGSDASVIQSGTAAAGGASTITIATALGADSLPNGCLIRITGGTGVGQCRAITGYVNATKVVTVDRAWVTNPDNTSTYNVVHADVPALNSSLKISGLVLADTVTTYTGNTPQTGDCYTKVDTEVATLVTGVADIQSRIPTSLTSNGNMKSSLMEILATALTETSGYLAAGFKKFFNVATPTSTMNQLTLVDTTTNLTNGVTLSAGDSPVMQSGTATAGGNLTITIQTALGADSLPIGATIKITSGTGAKQVRKITGYVNSTQVVTVDRAWVTNPDNTSVYSILYDTEQDNVVCRYGAAFTSSAGTTVKISAWLERNGQVVLVPTSCTVVYRENASGSDLFTATDASPSAQGVFEMSQSTPGFTSDRLYVASITIVEGNNTWTTREPVPVFG